MVDRATPNLPSSDFDRTEAFYSRIGFVRGWRDDGWMILERGGVVLEFFSLPGLDPATSAFSCCLRLDDVDAFFAECVAAGIEERARGWPRLHAPRREDWGGRVGALLDPDGTLLRLVGN